MRRSGGQRAGCDRQERLLFACLLCVTILVGHHVLMGGMWPTMPVAQADGHGATGLALLSSALPDARSPRSPCAPDALLGHCLDPQGLLPLLLLALAAIACLLPGLAGDPRLARGALGAAPPPLSPARRRALLQVFRC